MASHRLNVPGRANLSAPLATDEKLPWSQAVTLFVGLSAVLWAGGLLTVWRLFG